MSLMYMQMGMAVSRSVFSHKTAGVEADMARMQRDYSNTMKALSAAQELNTLTQNEISVRDAGVRASQAIQIQSMQDKAAATVSAAAAGVRGGSVVATMRGLTRSQLQAKQSLHDRMQAQATANTQNRRNVELSKVYGKDISIIPKPSSASALLGLGASLVDIYDSHQPEGSKIEDAVAGWFRKR